MKVKEYPHNSNYIISDRGAIWSKKRSRWLKPYKRSGNSEHLAADISSKTKMLHHLVLETYVGPCPKDMECRHLNGNPKDNRLENLKWGTRSENQQDAVKHGTHRHANNEGSRNGMSKLSEQDVRMIIYMYRTKLFTQKEISDLYNVNNSCISNIVNRKSWRHIWN